MMKGNCAFILSPILKINLFPTEMMTSKEEIALINVQGFFFSPHRYGKYYKKKRKEKRNHGFQYVRRKSKIFRKHTCNKQIGDYKHARSSVLSTLATLRLLMA